MAFIRREPFREMELLRRQMDQLFSDLAQANRGDSEMFSEAGTAWVPAVELKDTGSSLLLKAEVPGVEAKDLDIQVTRDAVSLAGEHRYEKRAESQGNVRSEFRYGRFQRVIPLPAKVQNDQVKADLNNGILTLTLPKMESEQNRVIKVNLGQSQPAAASIEAEHGNKQTNTESTQTVETASNG